ncbi:hypothetical protein ACFL47_02710 [Candidatus Latescibacterota bacterium]
MLAKLRADFRGRLSVLCSNVTNTSLNRLQKSIERGVKEDAFWYEKNAMPSDEIAS